MSIAVVLQARFGSQRLPGKALLPLGNSTVLDSVARRSMKISGNSHWFVTTDLKEDDPLAEICRNLGYEVFRGEVHDVLSRYEEVLKKTGAETIIRVTGDNPLTSFELANEMISEFVTIEKHFDSLRPADTWPIGLLPEVFRSSSLSKIRLGLKISESYHLSHVTSRLSQIGEINYFEINDEWLDTGFWRLTLDDAADYLLFTRLAGILSPESMSETSSRKLLNVLRNNISLSQLNAEVRQKRIEEG
jgi:spore coat polysaccharide biosynthesis protein SpsF